MSIKSIKKTIVETRIEECCIELDGENLVDILKMSGMVPPDTKLCDVSVQVRVPGGGDWSNTELDINKQIPIKVTYVIKSNRNFG